MKIYHITHIIRSASGKPYIITATGRAIKTDAARLRPIANAQDGNEVDPVAIDEAAEILRDMEHEAKKQAEEDDARNRCKAYAEELDAYAAGRAYSCPLCGEMLTADELDESEHEDADGNTLCTCPHCDATFERDEAPQGSLYDYLADVFGIEYRIDERGELRSVEFMLACGGPNIYADTARRAVVLYWWGTSAEYPIDSDTADALEEYARELRGEY